jgi:hypothetical protein
MAKKKKVKTRASPKRRISAGVLEGRVWCNVGIKPSQNYSSRDIGLGMETTILPDETDLEAMERVLGRVLAVFDDKAKPVMDVLGRKIQEVKGG